MGPQVILEQLVLGEGLFTDGALIGSLPAVDFLVPPQRSRSREALPTDVTAERFGSCVTPHVRLYVLKCLPTDLTCPATADSFSVRPEMVQQTV